MFYQVLSQCWNNYQQLPCCGCEQYRNYKICCCSFCLEKDFYKRPDEYECDKKMLFYVLNYGPIYVSDIYHYFEISHILDSLSRNINILSLGCGFCPDYYALTKYIKDYNLNISFSFTGLDKADTWDKTRSQYPNIRYMQADLTNLNYSLSFQNYDVIVLNKIFSTLYRHKTHGLFLQKIVNAIIGSMSKDAILIFNDVNDNNYSGRDEFNSAVSNLFDTVHKYYTAGYYEYCGGWIKIPETGLIYDKIPQCNISPLPSTKSVFFEYRKKL
jgi:SAM-dependent methyltransferase